MKSVVSAVFLTAALVAAQHTQAGVIYEVSEQNGDVVFEFSGTINLASTLGKEGDRSAFLNDFEGPRTFIRSVSGEADDYNVVYTTTSTFTGEATGGIRAGDNFTFENVLDGPFKQIWVPNNYVSGGPISGSLTFAGTDFATIGLTPGEYTWEWANGGVSDFVTVRVGSVVPEPSAAFLMLMFGTGWSVGRRR